MREDIKSSFRALGKRPGWTAFLVLTIALGVGVNTAMFSVAKKVLLQPLPYTDPDRLVFVYPGERSVCTLSNYLDWQQKDHLFSGLAAMEDSSHRATTDFAFNNEIVRIKGAAVTTNFLQVLGVRPLVGRDFRPDEENVVVITHDLWSKLFHCDVSAIGSTVTLDGQSHTLVGVLPPAFQFLLDRQRWDDSRVEAMEYFRPLVIQGAFLDTLAYRVVGRLRNGIPLETTGQRTAPGIAQPARGGIDRVVSLREEWFGPVEHQVWVIIAAAGLVLLVACTNVAALLLARGVSRTKEIAVRQALGAGRRRIVKRLLTESIVFAIISGLIGCLAAYLATGLLVSVIPPSVPRVTDVSVDWTSVVFALTLSALAGVLSGVVPAFRCSNVNLPVWLAQGGRGQGPASGARHIWYWLLVGQVAVSLVLLTCASLLFQSFWRLRTTDLGFQPEGLVTLQMTFRGEQYKGRVAAAAAALGDQLSALPGVTNVGFGFWRPFFGTRGCTYAIPSGRRDLAICVAQNSVDEGFFETLGIPIREGRHFRRSDGTKSEAVAIVSRSLARRIFPGTSAVGKFLENEQGSIQVVGVAGDIRDDELRIEPEPALYTPFAQEPDSRVYFYLRTAVAPSMLLPAIRRTAASTYPDLPVQNLTTVAEMASRALSVERFQASLLCLFAGIAVFLTVAAAYAVVSYVVASQTHDIGVRMTLGAGGRRVLFDMIARGMHPLVVGLPLGLVSSLSASRLVSATLYGIEPADPVTYVACSVALLLAFLLACAIPAQRASRLEPLEALGHE